MKLSLALLFSLISASAAALPGFAEVEAGWRSSDVIFTDRHGEEIQRVRVDNKVRRGDWVKLADVSPAFRQALVLSEDRRFYQHSGVDWSAVGAAAWSNLLNSRTRGASTLTMQLVGLIDDDLRRNSGHRSLWQKAGQTVSATWLERSWSKAQIMEGYVNLVGYRGELVGLDAAAEAMFGKLPRGLDARESAILVALLRAPNASDAVVGERACQIEKAMKTGSCQGLQGEVVLALGRAGSGGRVDDAQLIPHLARKLLAEHPVPAGSRVQTSVDAGLQRFAAQTLQRQIGEIGQRNVEDGALVVLDNASGQVLAWVGSSGLISRAGAVDGVTALRQAGSTLKPFLYEQAIAGRWLTAASLLDDGPLTVQTGNGAYRPQNYDKAYRGAVSVRTALASSLNIPAVRTIEIITPDRLRDTLIALGITTLTQPADFYGTSLALGSADVKLVELANAYRVLANLGGYSPVNTVIKWPDKNTKEGITPPQRKLDAAGSWIIGNILSDRTARAATFGLENVLATRYWAAVKTGTSKDMRDNWALGYSARYTVGVWVGNASGAPMWNVSGMHGAAPIWQAMMNRLHTSLPSRAPAMPAGVVRQHISFEKNAEAARDEYFLAGTQTGEVLAAQAGPVAITAPADGTIFAIDPDIPPQNQRIVFTASRAGEWWLAERKLGQGAQQTWFPWPGRYTLQLRQKGKVVDEVRFEVRGAGVKMPAKRKPG